jgi:hypothetical protein
VSDYINSQFQRVSDYIKQYNHSLFEIVKIYSKC